MLALVAAGTAAAVATSGIIYRDRSYADLQRTAIERSIPTVSVGTPQPASATIALDLPGRLEAYSRAALFARVSGYVTKWNADIGARVRAGDILAEIEAPDLDQQLNQARSDLVNAQVNLRLADITNQRYQALLPNNTISRQSADEKRADFNAKEALVKSAEANVARQTAMQRFKRIAAPFDGVVTARNTDIGALINAGSTAGTELFVISQTVKLRLYVNVPQSNAPGVSAGTLASVTVPERPGHTYRAQVEATSGAVDVASGSMRVQLAVDNAAGELLPGAYASVHFDIRISGNRLSVPASAIIFDQGGLKIATVSADDRIALKQVAVSRDLGNVVELTSGVEPDDRVVLNPPDDLVDGDQVKVKASRASAPPPRPTPAEAQNAKPGTDNGRRG